MILVKLCVDVALFNLSIDLALFNLSSRLSMRPSSLEGGSGVGLREVQVSNSGYNLC